MTVFVDTSALYALADEADANHEPALDTFRALRGSDLVTHEYVVVEALALFRRRLPWAATEWLMDDLLPLFDVRDVDGELYRSALSAYRESRSSSISFVDRTSFAFMRSQRLTRAFAFDADFARSGFESVA